MPLESLLASSVICSANSRVGVSISACIVLSFIFIFSKIGSRKASVLPLPVWASPITSLPDFMAGMLWLCTSVGSVIPEDFKTLIKFSLIFKSLKFILTIQFLFPILILNALR